MMLSLTPAVVGSVLLWVKQVLASDIGPWSSMLSLHNFLYGLLAATLAAILIMKLKKSFPCSWVSSTVRDDLNQFKINDHIYEFYKPKGHIEPAMEILFFHGLQFKASDKAYLSTWTSRFPGDHSTGDQVWPSTWLAEEFPNARVMSISYDSSMRRTPEQGRPDLFNVAETLIHAICLARIGQESRRPVILVGHSFGGLVIKQLCVQADATRSQRPDLKTSNMIGKFLHNVGGFFFYGTPHGGSGLGDMAFHVLNGPLLDYVQSLSAVSARLHQQFCDVCSKYKICRIAGVGELSATSWGPFHGVVVPEASARYGEFCIVQEDHISLCKPMARTSMTFQRLTTFIRNVVPKDEARFENRQQIPEAAVGLDLVVKEVQDKLQRNSRVGLVGMGGLGKTTLAMAVFNKLGPTFEYSCFVPEVKLIAKRVGVHSMKKELWKRMHCRGKKVADPDKEDWSQLRKKKLLLVLDDVAEDHDLRVLLGIVAEDIAPESRVIITARNGDVLSRFQYDIDVYQVQLLNKTNAKELFISFAFPVQRVPPVALETLVDLIVEKCDGLPLTLDVLGNYLKKKKGVIEIWMQTLEALEKADNVAGLDEKVWAKLMLSYTGLSTEEEQHMFLDATTFFSGNIISYCTDWRLNETTPASGVSSVPYGNEVNWTLREAKAAWSVTYGYEHLRWRSLVDMSLVYDVEEDEPIKVHEQLQSLGRKIASNGRKDGKSIRVWKWAETSPEVLKLLQATDKSNDQELHSLRLVAPQHGHVNIPRSCFGRFKKLKYLDVYLGDRSTAGSTPWLVMDGPEENETIPTDLVLLRLPTLQFGQVVFDPALLPRLAVLKLSSYELTSLPPSIGQLSALKILSIASRDLEILPDEIGHLSKLEQLRLNCGRLLTVPETFGNLSKLKRLAFNLCCSFHSVPESFGRLLALEELELCGCHSFHSLPESFGGLSVLRKLEFYGCSSLHSVPESFGGLSALQKLVFSHCGNLHTIPESFGRLSSLQHLNLVQCVNLLKLPESFGQLSALQHFELNSSIKLRSLPNSFGRLSALRDIEFYFCKRLHSLPASFGGLSALQKLAFYYCNELSTFPESFGGLSSLQELLFHRCGNLQTLPESFGELSALQQVHFNYCGKLGTLPESVGQLSKLKRLGLVKCHDLHTLPKSIGTLSNLTHLAFLKCDNLCTLPGSLGQLANLEELIIHNCRKLERLPFSSPQLKVLSRLAIRYTALVSIPNWINSLPSLQILDLGYLPYVDGWPSWLGESPLHLTTTSWTFFRTQDGYFAPIKEGHKLVSEWHWNFTQGPRLGKWLHNNAMDKVTALDYAGAIADLQRALGVLGHDEADDWWRRFILQERGIIKRFKGDLRGALQDLTMALEAQSPGVEYPACRVLYDCRKHRGYVRYLLGDEQGAQEDIEEALKQGQESYKDVASPSLGSGEFLSYLGFRFDGVKRDKHKRHLLRY